jgi:hypothetical protein
MSRTLRQPRRRTGRCRPHLERLESRLALTTSDGSVLVATAFAAPQSASDTTDSTTPSPFLTPVATDPAPNATLTHGPTTVTVTFDRPIDPSSFLAGDVVIEERVNGNWISFFGPLSLPDESLDPTGTELSLDLNQPLPPGQYQIVLPEDSPIMGLDGSSVADLGQDQVLGQFKVDQPGVTLADASDVGTVGSVPVTVAGNLDIADNPGAVMLYKFTLPAGHHWRFGAEIDAQRDGSPLRSALALFDGQGRLITTANIGRADAPHDPYLFSGLDGGTYFIGVSGQVNVPGQPGGYDPITGQWGPLPDPLDGGAFHLTIVADAADSPVRLLGFTLDHADPASQSPTGLTLAFSGLLNNDTLHGNPSKGLELVNQTGQTFPLAVVGSNEAAAQYSILFDEALPAGRYTLRVRDKADGGVTDLAGLTPVASGQPAGVLATFQVTATGNSHTNRHDLGALFNDVHNGISGSDTVAPGTAVAYRFVVLGEGQYHIQTEYLGGSLTIQVIGNGHILNLDAGAPGVVSGNDVYLTHGVYYLQFVNTGKSAAALTWTVSEKTAWESLLNNGVGQGPALNLRLVDPTSSGLTPDSSPLSSGPTPTPPPTAPPSVVGGPFLPESPTTAASPTTAIASSSASATTSNVSLAPGGLFLTVGNTLVGRPSIQSDHVAAVGTGAQSGTIALASITSGLPAGIVIRPIRGDEPSLEPVPEALTDAGEPVELQPVNGAIVAESSQTRDRLDEQVIASADWLTQIGMNLAHWVKLSPKPEPTPAARPEPVEITALRRDDLPQEASDRVEQAQFGPPLVIGLASLMAMRYQPIVRRWLKRTPATGSSKAGASGFNAVRGPHRRQ